MQPRDSFLRLRKRSFLYTVKRDCRFFHSGIREVAVTKAAEHKIGFLNVFDARLGEAVKLSSQYLPRQKVQITVSKRIVKI